MSEFLNRLLQRSFEPESLRVKANIPSRFEPLPGSNESLDSEEVVSQHPLEAPQESNASAWNGRPPINSSTQVTNVNVSEYQAAQVAKTINIQTEANGSNDRENKPQQPPTIQVIDSKRSVPPVGGNTKQIETNEKFVERVVVPEEPSSKNADSAPPVPAILNPASVEVPSIVAESAKTESVVKVSILSLIHI